MSDFDRQVPEGAEGLPFYIEVFEKPAEDELPAEEAPKCSNSEENGPKLAVTVSVYGQGEEGKCLASLEELGRLCETAGAQVSGIVTQMRPAPDTKTAVGKGKLEELSRVCRDTGASFAVFDFELTPSQIREIENAMETEVSVLDRSMLILDIFAMRARSAEGRLQVELAQLKYTAPRLMGRGRDMSRLGGGIGTRGPGESKLEIDRRRIRSRITYLEQQLRQVEKNRATMRAARERSGIKKCAVVGYTNAGKSTLTNRLCDAGVLAEDKLFATLDPTTRKYQLPGGTKILITDTVGFINNLPHHLIKSFKSTLDEAAFSDVLMVVCDASDENFADHLTVTEGLLADLGAAGIPTLFVFNKCDKIAVDDRINRMKAAASGSGSEYVFISALTGEGCDELANKLESLCRKGKRPVKVLIPSSEGGLLNLIYKDGDSVSTEYRDNGVLVSMLADDKLRGRLVAYIIDTDTGSGSIKES